MRAIVLLVAFAVLPSLALAEGTHTMSAPYTSVVLVPTSATALLPTAQDPQCPTTDAPWRLCFPVDSASFTKVRIEVADDVSTADIFAKANFTRADGSYGAIWFVCGFGDFRVHSSYQTLRVDVYSGPGINPADCDGRPYPVVEPIGVATTGTVMLTFS